jgi:hypothetical protein
MAALIKQEKITTLLFDEVARQVEQIDFSRGLERKIDLVKACEVLP